MARRERTTGLPRARRRDRADMRPRVLGIPWDEGTSRLAILGFIGLLLVLVLGLIGYRVYDQRWATPNKVILRVGNEEFKLSYYADRLTEFAKANPGSDKSVIELGLLNKLQEEGLTVQLARERGIGLSADDVSNSIAQSLGVPVGGTGSSFDQLYRNRLRTLKMSDGNYRRLAEADLANTKLLDLFKQEVGDKAETLTLRTVVVDSQEKADAIVQRIKAGEDMGTIAQTESADLTSRQQDGMMQPEPPKLLPESVRAAVEGKGNGELVGPVQVQQNWWVFRLEKRDPQGTLGDAQKAQLAQGTLDEAIAARRSSTTIKRNLDARDIDWAVKHAD